MELPLEILLIPLCNRQCKARNPCSDLLTFARWRYSCIHWLRTISTSAYFKWFNCGNGIDFAAKLLIMDLSYLGLPVETVHTFDIFCSHLSILMMLMMMMMMMMMKWCWLDTGVRFRTAMRVQRAAFRRPLHAVPVSCRPALVRGLQPPRPAPQGSVLSIAPSTPTRTLLPVRQDDRGCSWRHPRTSHDQLRPALFRTAPESRDIRGSHVTHYFMKLFMYRGLGHLVFYKTFGRITVEWTDKSGVRRTSATVCDLYIRLTITRRETDPHNNGMWRRRRQA